MILDFTKTICDLSEANIIFDINNVGDLCDIHIDTTTDKVIFKATVIDENNNIDILALVKSMVELFNLGEEYKINIAIPVDILTQYIDINSIYDVINAVFYDYKFDVFIYNQVTI